MSEHESQKAAAVKGTEKLLAEITQLHNDITADAAKMKLTVDEFLDLCLKGAFNQQGGNGNE